MKKQHAVKILTNEDGDWMAVYIDGTCKFQGHSIEESRLLDLVGVEHEGYEVSAGYLEEQHGVFPHSDQQLPDDARKWR